MSHDTMGFVPDTVVCPGCEERAEEKPWNAHPGFKGVALRHLITGKETDGTFSSHVVRVEPGCCLDSHVHEGQWELHEIMQGTAVAQVGTKELKYTVGSCAVIPKGVSHKVQAGEDGLMILAKFVPALI